MKKINALVIGHTGATGEALIEHLINSAECDSIIAIGRRENTKFKDSKKLKQYILPDMLEISSFDKNLLTEIDSAFCCIGTTFNDVFKNSKAQEYENVDYKIATGFAKLAHESGANFISIITGEKADSKSKYRMTRVKGETEDFIINQGFQRVSILRPGLLNRGTGRRGWLEQIFTVGGIFGTPVKKLAEAMIWTAFNQTKPLMKYESSDINEIIKSLN